MQSQVADICAELLTPHRIRIIAEEVITACQASGEYLSIKKIKAAIKDADDAIENLWVALEKGQSVDRITKSIEQREAEKKDLEKQLAKEKRKQPGLQLPMFSHFWTTSVNYQELARLNEKALSIFLLMQSIYMTIITQLSSMSEALHSRQRIFL